MGKKLVAVLVIQLLIAGFIISVPAVEKLSMKNVSAEYEFPMDNLYFGSDQNTQDEYQCYVMGDFRPELKSGFKKYFNWYGQENGESINIYIDGKSSYGNVRDTALCSRDFDPEAFFGGDMFLPQKDGKYVFDGGRIRKEVTVRFSVTGDGIVFDGLYFDGVPFEAFMADIQSGNV